MKYSIFFIIIFLIFGTLSAWENMYGWVYDEVIYSLEITSNKDYVIAGYKRIDDYPQKYFYIIKISQFGDSLWARTYIRGEAHDIKHTFDGNYIVSGYNSFDEKYYLTKIATNGDIIWTSSIIESPHYQHNSSVLQTQSRGYVVVWGTSPEFHDFFILRADSLGDSIWTRRMGRELNDHAFYITEASDRGWIIVAFTHVGTSYEEDVYIIKIDSLGNREWDTTYGGLGRDTPYFISQSFDSCYIIIGRTSLYYDILFDVYLLKINEDGDTLWTRKIGSDYESDIGRCVKQTYDGGYIITGYTYSYGPGTPDSSNVYLVKTDSEGYVEWERTYGGTGEDKGYSVSQTEDGSYIIAGVYDQGPHTDVYLIKTDSLGETEWIREVPTKPQEFSMNVYPNPFNSTCKIIVAGSGLQVASLEIFDINGRIVGSLDGGVDGPESLGPRITGSPVYSWQPDNKVTSGVYLVRAEAGKEVITKKIIYLK